VNSEWVGDPGRDSFKEKSIVKCEHCGSVLEGKPPLPSSTSSSGPLDSEPIHLTIDQVGKSSSIDAERVFKINKPITVIGRDPRCDVYLNDTSIGRRHALIRQTRKGVFFETLSRQHHSFVDRKPVRVGDVYPLRESRHSIQMGQVLLRLELNDSSSAVEEILQSHVDSPTVDPKVVDPFMSVHWNRNVCHVRVKGRLFDLFPVAGQILGKLCSTPGVPVHNDDIRSFIGPSSQIEQQITYIRKALEKLVELNIVSEDELKTYIRSNTCGGNLKKLDTMSVPQLLRCFISSKRGYGYTINIDPSLIATTTENRATQYS